MHLGYEARKRNRRYRNTRFAALLVAGALIGFPVSASAAPIDIGFSGTYTEDGSSGSGSRDDYSFTNDGQAQIGQIVLDLSGGMAYFDPAGSPFAVTGGGAVGFDGNFALVGTGQDARVVTLTFTDFDPGESFLFAVETDDTGGYGYTTGADFAGAEAIVTFLGVSYPTMVSAIYEVDLLDSNTANVSFFGVGEAPEPGTAVLVALGLVGLAVRERRRAA